MSELVHFASLFNVEVNKYAHPLIKDFPWSTQLVTQMSKEFGDSLTQLDEITIRSYLSGKLMDNEVSEFIDNIKQSREITSSKQVEIIANNILKYYKSQRVLSIVQQYSDDPTKIVSEIKSIPDNITSESMVVKLSDIDPETEFQEEVGGDAIPSQFKSINESTPFNGYLPGSVVSVTAGTGGGKSAFMMYEVVPMAMSGKKVLWLAMGDLLRFDFLTRFTAVATSVDYFKVVQHPNKYYLDVDLISVRDNIDLIAVPSRKLSSKQLIAYLNSVDTRYDIVVVDYDSNFDQPHESMYDSGGAIYDDMVEIARPDDQPNRLVMIASQPKPMYWESEVIPKDGLAESSRKQHIIDMMITLGKAKSAYPIGMLSIVKNRRGTEVCVPVMRDACGHFREITTQDYAMMKSYGDKKN